MNAKRSRFPTKVVVRTRKSIRIKRTVRVIQRRTWTRRRRP